MWIVTEQKILNATFQKQNRKLRSWTARETWLKRLKIWITISTIESKDIIAWGSVYLYNTNLMGRSLM